MAEVQPKPAILCEKLTSKCLKCKFYCCIKLLYVLNYFVVVDITRRKTARPVHPARIVADTRPPGDLSENNIKNILHRNATGFCNSIIILYVHRSIGPVS